MAECLMSLRKNPDVVQGKGWIFHVNPAPATAKTLANHEKIALDQPYGCQSIKRGTTGVLKHVWRKAN